jgi:hypothetical protein
MIFRKIHNANALFDEHEKDLGGIVGPSGHGNLCGGSSNPCGELDWLRTGYFAEDESYKLSENGSVGYNITEQKGRLFTGNITYVLNGTKYVEGFAGAIGIDNKTLYLAEIGRGYDLGTIISDDEIELMYIEDGESGWAAINKLHR